MTTLKNYTGDEIAAALAEQLKDEEFVGLYRKAADAWWAKGPTAAAYKREIDAAQSADQVTAVRNKYLAAGSPLAGKLGAEGIDDFQPLIEYANDKAVQFEYVADDGQAAVDGVPKPKIELFEPGDPRAVAPEMTEKEVSEITGQKADDKKPCGCPVGAVCVHDGALSTAAVNFANRHLAKLATALDVAGFAGMADEIDGLMGKFAAKKKKKEEKEEEEEHGDETKGKKKRKRKGGEKEEKDEKEEKEQDAKDGKKHRGRSYSEWVRHFNAHGKSTGEKFRKTFKGALEYAKKEKDLSGDKAEEYAMRTALDKMPQSYFKEPSKVHGPGKSGPKVTKKKK